MGKQIDAELDYFTVWALLHHQCQLYGLEIYEDPYMIQQHGVDGRYRFGLRTTRPWKAGEDRGLHYFGYYCNESDGSQSRYVATITPPGYNPKDKRVERFMDPHIACLAKFANAPLGHEGWSEANTSFHSDNIGSDIVIPLKPKVYLKTHDPLLVDYGGQSYWDTKPHWLKVTENDKYTTYIH